MELLKGAEWLSLVASALIGFFIERLIRVIDNYGSSTASVYIGRYYSYHLSSSGSGHVIEYSFRIYRKFNGSIGVERRQQKPIPDEFIYRGDFNIRDRMIYIDLSGENNSEKIRFSIAEPVGRRIIQVVGLISGMNMKKEPWAGVELIVSQPIREEKVKEILEVYRSVVVPELIESL